VNTFAIAAIILGSHAMSVKKQIEEDLDFADEIVMFHVMPDDSPDLREHLTSEKCWCDPKLQYKNPETGNEVWLHFFVQ